MKKILNYINGNHSANSNEFLDVENPAIGEKISEVVLSDNSSLFIFNSAFLAFCELIQFWVLSTLFLCNSVFSIKSSNKFDTCPGTNSVLYD